MYDDSEFYRFTVDQYHKLGQLGIVTADDNVELLEGYLVTKAPPAVASKNPAGLERAFAEHLPDGWCLLVHMAVTLSGVRPESEPEPDYAVVRGSRKGYRDIAPTSTDVRVVVEIASSVPDIERKDLARIYARAGIPEYWLVDSVGRNVEVYTHPSGPIDSPHYGKRDTYPVGLSIPVVLDGVSVGTVAVAEVMA